MKNCKPTLLHPIFESIWKIDSLEIKLPKHHWSTFFNMTEYYVILFNIIKC